MSIVKRVEPVSRTASAKSPSNMTAWDPISFCNDHRGNVAAVSLVKRASIPETHGRYQVKPSVHEWWMLASASVDIPGAEDTDSYYFISVRPFCC